jgi:hypothetical protein
MRSKDLSQVRDRRSIRLETSMARIFPVIEIASDPTELFWLPLRSTHRHAFVELGAETPPDQVALVLHTLATYGHASGASDSPRALNENFPEIAPGGLAVSDEDLAIFPSCCCGLETWREWWGLLDGGQSPWLGHSPDPWVEQVGDEFVVWSDGAFSTGREGATRVHLSRSDLSDGLRQVATSLEAFAARLESVLRDHWVPEAAAIAQKFRATFVSPPG